MCTFHREHSQELHQQCLCRCVLCMSPYSHKAAMYRRELTFNCAYIQAAQRLCCAHSLGSCKEPGCLADHHFKSLLHPVGALEDHGCGELQLKPQL